MSQSAKILIIVGVIALVGFIIYSTTGLAKVGCEVCIEFRGRTSCRTAYGTNRDEALQTATGVACAELASGRDESISCTQMTRPKSVSCN